MDENQTLWQNDAKRAFDWINSLYEQAQAMLSDAQAYIEEQGWSVTCGGGFGGVAMSVSDLSEWPFVYFKCLGGTPSGSPDVGPGHGLFLGVIFYDTKRHGPTLVAGRVSWNDAKANCDHWILLAATASACPKWAEGSFDVGQGSVRISRPTARAANIRPGVGDVTWFEKPLSCITSADLLRELVDATIALAGGDGSLASAIVVDDERQ